MARPAVLMTALIALMLSACVTLPDASYPIHRVATGELSVDDLALLPPVEITAVLEVDQAGQRSSYLLALQSASGNVDLALLTPQGAPLYQLHWARGESLLTRKLASGRAPRPQDLLVQLQLVYGAEPALRRILRPGWVVQQGVGERFLVHAESRREIAISYAGTGPWFSPAQFVDSLHDTRLTIRIQERRDVLPE